MTDTLGYAAGFPGWRESHGYKAGLEPGGPLGLVVTCPQGQTRAELQSPWDAMDGADHFYGFTVQLPDGFKGGTADWLVLAQGHEDGVAKPPPWSIVAKTTGLRLEMRHKDGTREIRELGPLPIDRPAGIAVNYLSSLTIDGLIAVHRDGTRMGLVAGSNRYTDRYPVRPRVGVYRGHTGGIQTAWFGPLMRGGSLQDVTAAAGGDCCGELEEARGEIALLRQERDGLAARIAAAARALEG